MIIRPVLMTSVDHMTWNAIRKDHGIPEISRGKDLSHPAFFIDLQDERSLELVHLGFLVVTDDYKVIAKIALETDCTIRCIKEYGAGDSEYLITGSLRTLRDTCVSASTKMMPTAVRHLANCIHQLMVPIGLKSLWDGRYTKTCHNDGTYTLTTRK